MKGPLELGNVLEEGSPLRVPDETDSEGGGPEAGVPEGAIGRGDLHEVHL